MQEPSAACFEALEGTEKFDPEDECWLDAPSLWRKIVPTQKERQEFILKELAQCTPDSISGSRTEVIKRIFAAMEPGQDCFHAVRRYSNMLAVVRKEIFAERLGFPMRD